MRRALPRLLAESVLIVLSILLALAVDEWRQDREKRQVTERALDAFRHEIVQNRESLRRAMPYHQRLRGEFERLAEAGEIRTFDDLRKVPDFRGFQPAFLQNTAWTTAVTTGALGTMEYHRVAELSALSTQQERFELVSRPTFIIGPAMMDENIPGTLRTVLFYLGDVTYGEAELLAAYDRALERLGPASPQNPPQLPQ